MKYRAEPSGITIGVAEAAIIKGMLNRGDRQHDVAAWFGVNGGRIAEIANGLKFSYVESAAADQLPPVGPYMPGRDTAIVMQALAIAREAFDRAEAVISKYHN